MTMVFVEDGFFPYLGRKYYSQWVEVLQQYQIAVDGCSVGLVVSGGHLNPYKVS